MAHVAWRIIAWNPFLSHLCLSHTGSFDEEKKSLVCDKSSTTAIHLWGTSQTVNLCFIHWSLILRIISVALPLTLQGDEQHFHTSVYHTAPCRTKEEEEEESRAVSQFQLCISQDLPPGSSNWSQRCLSVNPTESQWTLVCVGLTR